MTNLSDTARSLLALAEAEAKYDAEWNDKWGDGFEDFDPAPKKYLTACSPETIASLCRAYLDMERDAERKQSALERITTSYRMLLSRKPVLDATETLAEAYDAMKESNERPDTTG